MTTSDAELVMLVRERGDVDSYGELINRYQGHAYGLAYSLIGDWEEAKDIAQESFIQAYVNLGTLKDPAKFAAWLRRIVFSTCMRWLRTYHPDLYQSLDQSEEGDFLDKIPDTKSQSPLDNALHREMSGVILAAIAELPPKYRIPLTMFHLDGLSYEKVAEFLEIPLGTVKSLINRARKKLKRTLKNYAEEVLPMVKEVFDEHKLPPEFSRKILENVPILTWGKGKECTFIGALEAAISVTENPYSYSDLMGYSGLAFRVRWWKPVQDNKWCPSCAVGEMEEEIETVSRRTGWILKVELNHDDASKNKAVQKVIASLKAGKPVLAYDDRIDMAVIYGFDEGGEKLFFRDYHKGTMPHILPASQIGWMVAYLGDYHPIITRKDAFLESLEMAVRNWNRELGRSGPGEYWYGRTALAKWREDLNMAESFTQKEQETLFFVSWWNFTSLFDARKAAVKFLNENLSLLDSPQSRDHIQKASYLYQKEIDDLALCIYTNHEAFFGPWSGKSINDWTKDVRELESRILTDIIDVENNAIKSLDMVLKK